jgi:hypothetical protein
MRDRTWVGESGKKHAGTDMIATIWDRQLADSIGVRRQENLQLFMKEIERAVEGRPDGADLIEEMLTLGSVTRGPDGLLVDAARGVAA